MEEAPWPETPEQTQTSDQTQTPAQNRGASEGAVTPEVVTPDPGDKEAVEGWGELLYGVLFQPVKTLRHLANQPALGKALLVLLLLQFGNWYMVVATTPEEPLLQAFQASYPNFVDQLPAVLFQLKLLSVGAGLFFALFLWFISSALFNLLAELQGGKSNGRGLLTVLGFAQLPQIVLIPARYLFLGIHGGQLGMSLISVGVGVWVLILNIIGIRESTGLSQGKAILTFFLPGLLAAGGAFFLVLIGILALFPLFS